MERIKYLKLSTEDFFGAGEANVRRVEWLNANGIDAKMIVFEKRGHSPYVIACYDYNKKTDRFLLKVTKRLKSIYKKHVLKVVNTRYDMYNIELNLISARRILRLYGDMPDIIDVSWVTDFISYKTVLRLADLTHARVVYTMNDSAHFTGGCHSPWNCKGYENDCYPCPALAQNDRRAQKTLQKKKKYTPDKPILVGSCYDCIRASSSTLFKDKSKFFPSSQIRPNPFTFNKQVGRKRWNIPDDDIVLMFGASNTAYERKGFSELLSAINLLRVKLSNTNISLLVAGICDYEFPSDIKVVKTGVLNFEDLFVAYYCSDLYLSPSLEDSGPAMLKYAFVAKKPVVCFPVGYALDLIKHKQNGYVAHWRDVEDLAAGIEYCIDNLTNMENNIDRINDEISNAINSRTSLYDYLGILH